MGVILLSLTGAASASTIGDQRAQCFINGLGITKAPRDVSFKNDNVRSFREELLYVLPTYSFGVVEIVLWSKIVFDSRCFTFHVVFSHAPSPGAH